MRILHVPYSFFPDPPGGTEIYVDSLASWQRKLGCDAGVAAPSNQRTRYDHRGIPVWRFPVSTDLKLRDLYGEGDNTAADAFGRILDQFCPEVVHLHSFTSAVSVKLAAQAAGRCIPIVMNYHTPTVTCARGTLLRWGSEICDGYLDQSACAACALHARGLVQPLAALVGSLPVAFSAGFGYAGLEGGAWTALRIPELIKVRISSFHRLTAMLARVIALCDWTRELLIRNGVNESRITLCRQGICWQPEDLSATGARCPSQTPLRAAFLGRLDPTKGPHVVVEGLRNNPELPTHLDIFGVSQGEAGDRYASSLRKLAANDGRIRMLPPVPPGEVVSLLGQYDVLVVPSQWLETGPLVALEAFAAGIPVIGSNLGGIAELVANGVDGLLIEPPSSAAAWADALRRVCIEPGLLVSLRRGIRPPKHMRQVAEEMMSLYDDVVHNHACSPACLTG